MQIGRCTPKIGRTVMETLDCSDAMPFDRWAKRNAEMESNCILIPCVDSQNPTKYLDLALTCGFMLQAAKFCLVK